MLKLKVACVGVLSALAVGCVSIDGIAIGSDSGSGSSVPASRFICDNGYKAMISYRSNDEIMVAFNNGKDTFVIPAHKTAGNVYVAHTNTVKWQESNGVGLLTYPDNNYRDNKKIHQTTCRVR